VELRHRLVRIFQPTRNTMQSGGAKGEKWRIDWDVLQGAGVWQNPLMGWASSYVSVRHFSANVHGLVIVSADYMQGTRISFNTREDAVRFAEKQGGGCICDHSENNFDGLIRMGLLRSTGNSQTRSSEEL
jgi:NADH dehydrogenase (ubiquinone) Fe-S protein 4